MKGLFWNVIGVRKKGLAVFVRSLIEEMKFDFMCFQKTIL
jgi:hypothetical protein